MHWNSWYAYWKNITTSNFNPPFWNLFTVKTGVNYRNQNKSCCKSLKLEMIGLINQNSLNKYFKPKELVLVFLCHSTCFFSNLPITVLITYKMFFELISDFYFHYYLPQWFLLYHAFCGTQAFLWMGIHLWCHSLEQRKVHLFLLTNA